MQAGMVAVLVAGLMTGNYTWVPAALVALVVSEVPSLLRRDLKLVLPVELNLWMVLALFLHVVGGFSGFYDHVPGWDHLTHAMSASLVAALGFVTVVVLDKYADSIYLPRMFLAFFIIMLTMAIGVCWELMEYLNDELTGSSLQYSLSDTMTDLLFDAFGGFIVGAYGAYYLTYTPMDRFVESLQLEEAKGRVIEVIEKRKSSVRKK
jgi:hypothetical protein